MIKAAAALLLFAAVSAANLLDGYYQVVSLTVTRDGQPVRGANNSGLYIYATGRRVVISGAYRGFPFKRDMVVERVSRDTLTLYDARDRSSRYKFLVSGSVITGRHALTFDDGTRQVIETIVTVRRLRPEEAERLRGVVEF